VSVRMHPGESGRNCVDFATDETLDTETTVSSASTVSRENAHVDEIEDRIFKHCSVENVRNRPG